MKINAHGSRRRGGQDGMAVIVVLALLAIMLIYIAANLRTLSSLGAELKLLEKQQMQLWRSKAAHVETVSTDSAPALPTN